MNKQKPENVGKYGQALLQARGGWTLREILGSSYARFRSNGRSSYFSQRSSCEEPERNLKNSATKEK